MRPFQLQRADDAEGRDPGSLAHAGSADALANISPAAPRCST